LAGSRPGKRPILCLVLDRGVARRDPGEIVEVAAGAGIDWLQIRDRSLPGARLLEFAIEMQAAAERGAGERTIEIIVNRRIDIALSIDAEGAHLGFDAISIAEARRLLPDARLGISAHSPEEVARQAEDGADYAHLAPIYPPLSKRGTRTALGLDAISQAADQGIPIIAQGGITARNCGDIIRAGASGIAVTGAILLNAAPARATSSLRAALDAALS
jgi:thiamine-phosphate pyrophosphorylase